MIDRALLVEIHSVKRPITTTRFRYHTLGSVSLYVTLEDGLRLLRWLMILKRRGYVNLAC